MTEQEKILFEERLKILNKLRETNFLIDTVDKYRDFRDWLIERIIKNK